LAGVCVRTQGLLTIPIVQKRERVMKTLDEIKYEINFIENELVNRDFTYLKVEELNSWLVALQWTLKGESNE
jgi:hypothetical protein